MKTKLTLTIMTFVTALLYSLQTANAQNTWSLAGNSNATANSKMGTTNAIPLRLSTNNQTRVYINANTGNVGIGTGDNSTLNYKLQVTGDAYGIYGFGSTYGLFGSGDYGVYGAGNTYGLYGTGNNFGVYAAGNTYGVYGTGNGYGLSGYSSDGEGVYGLSSTGYGVHGSSGYLGVYGDGTTFGLYGTSDNGYAVFGTSSGSYGVYGRSGYVGVYGSGNSYGVYGYSSAGNGVRAASVNSDGAYFTSYSAYGIRAGTTHGSYAGVFDGNVYAFGNYYSSSDKNLKKNIQDFGDAMSIINKLKPKNYEFRTDDKFASLNLPKGTHYGLVAQDVEEVLPNLVKESPQEIGSKADEPIKPRSNDGKAPTAATEQKVTKVEPGKKELMNIKGVNYEELIPIIIKGMQEQEAKIESLTQLVNKLQGSAVSSGSQNNIAVNFAGLSTASLDQNIPNPLNNSTSIHYSVPSGSSKALLNITDNNGNTVKQIQLNGMGNGLVNIETSGLSAGTYSYTLIVDGKQIETKKMVIAR
jgi:hypothetical protein